MQELADRHGKTGYVFKNTDGNQLRNARDWFEPAVVLAKLDDYTWHCNRHTFASRLVMADVNIRTVADLLGHTTIQMTMRYSHLAPAHNQDAVDRLVQSATENNHQPKPTATKTATRQRAARPRTSKN